MLPVDDAPAAAVDDKPLATGLVLCAADEEAQQILELLHDLTPGEIRFPTQHDVNVLGICSNAMQAPPAAGANVVGAEDEDFLDVLVEFHRREFGAVIVVA